MGKQNRHHVAGLLLKLPEGVFKTGIGLIDQEMWCWGCDVRRAEGNLLTQYGFTKRPSPEPRYHSAYTLYGVIPDGTLTLWGWGLWIAAPERGSLFISRDRFRVRWIPQTDLAPSNDGSLQFMNTAIAHAQSRRIRSEGASRGCTGGADCLHNDLNSQR